MFTVKYNNKTFTFDCFEEAMDFCIDCGIDPDLYIVKTKIRKNKT